jgi:fatty-acyl-CoA synthase
MTADAKLRPHRTPLDPAVTIRGWAAAAALVLAILAALTLAFAPFGVREQMFDLDYAVRVLATGWAPRFALAAVVVGALAFLAALLVPPRRDRIASLLAVALGAVALAVSGQVRTAVAANPPIHDVATDWADPLVFGPRLVADRGQAANPVAADPRVQPQPYNPNLTGTRIAEVNARTCPAAVPVVLAVPVQVAYDKAHAALLGQGLTLVTENPAAGRIEATATSRYLKLQGDVLVRVKAEGAGARVDIRSVSRTGIADLGENCRRIGRLRRAIGG